MSETLNVIAETGLKVKHGIEQIEAYLKSHEVEDKEKFENLLKEYFEAEKDNKEALKEKANAILYVCKQLEASIKVDESIKRGIDARIKSQKNKQEALKERIRYYLDLFGMLETTLKLDYFTVYQTTSRSLYIDKDKLPDIYKKAKIEHVPDTDKIKQLLSSADENEESVDWASYIEKKVLNVRGGSIAKEEEKEDA